MPKKKNDAPLTEEMEKPESTEEFVENPEMIEECSNGKGDDEEEEG